MERFAAPFLLQGSKTQIIQGLVNRDEYKNIDDFHQFDARSGGDICPVCARSTDDAAKRAAERFPACGYSAHGGFILFLCTHELDSQRQRHWRDLCTACLPCEFQPLLNWDVAPHQISTVPSIQPADNVGAGCVHDVRITFLLAGFSRHWDCRT